MQTKYPTYRYPTEIERSMLEYSMTIKINGKKRSKAEVKRRAVG